MPSLLTCASSVSVSVQCGLLLKSRRYGIRSVRRLLDLYLPRACPFGSGAIRQLSTIVPSNFRACRFPDLVVLADMLQRGVERADAVGQAGQVRMQRDVHDASGLGALATLHRPLRARARITRPPAD